jgi:hypothetical protein
LIRSEIHSAESERSEQLLKLWRQRSGEIRAFPSPGFGLPGLPKNDDYLLQRITLDADLHLNENIRFFVQGISGLQLGGNENTTAGGQ